MWVDGVHLPLPKLKGLGVPRRACDLMKVIDRMGKAPRPDFNPYESDLKRAGFTITDEAWPAFPHEPSTDDKRGLRSV